MQHNTHAMHTIKTYKTTPYKKHFFFFLQNKTKKKLLYVFTIFKSVEKCVIKMRFRNETNTRNMIVVLFQV